MPYDSYAKCNVDARMEIWKEVAACVNTDGVWCCVSCCEEPLSGFAGLPMSKGQACVYHREQVSEVQALNRLLLTVAMNQRDKVKEVRDLVEHLLEVGEREMKKACAMRNLVVRFDDVQKQWTAHEDVSTRIYRRGGGYEEDADAGEALAASLFESDALNTACLNRLLEISLDDAPVDHNTREWAWALAGRDTQSPNVFKAFLSTFTSKWESDWGAGEKSLALYVQVFEKVLALPSNTHFMKVLIAMDGLAETEEERYSRAGSQYSERFGLTRVPFAIASRKEEYAAAKKRQQEDEVCVQNLDVALASAAESVPLDATCNRPVVAPDAPSQMQDVQSSMFSQPGSALAYLRGGWMQDLEIALVAAKY